MKNLEYCYYLVCSELYVSVAAVGESLQCAVILWPTACMGSAHLLTAHIHFHCAIVT